MKYETLRIATGLFCATQPIVSGGILPIVMVISPIASPEVTIAVCVTSWIWLSGLAVMVSIRIMREIEAATTPPPPTVKAEKRIVPVWNNGKRTEVEL